MNKSLIDTAIEYAKEMHLGTNHTYGDQPYTYHLKMVADVAIEFKDFIPVAHWDNVLAACWLHDIIEDCRQTYNDVKNRTNAEVADIVYAVTNEKGKNRKERANWKYYEGIRDTRYATFVKLCDRIANVTNSKIEGKMLDLYKSEHEKFVSELDKFNVYTDLFERLRQLLYE